MSRQYRTPPILEATFEARFETSPDYNVFTPLQIYNELRGDFPTEPVLISDQGVEIVNDQREGKDTTFRLKREQYRYQLASRDASSLARFNRRMLSVHASAPYRGWEEFRERIQLALSSYLKVAQPVALSRLSLRYVNQISFDDDSVDLSEYFTMPLDTPKGTPAQLGAFFQRLEFFWPEAPFKLVQTYGSTGSEKLSVLLDIDMISESSEQFPVYSDGLVKKIDDLREMQRQSFEASITDKLREMFDAT